MTEHQFTDYSRVAVGPQDKRVELPHGTNIRVEMRKLLQFLRSRCSCERVVFLSVILALSAVVITLGNRSSDGKAFCQARHQDKRGSKELKKTGQEVDMDLSASHILDLRISINTSPCKKPSCITCKDYVVPHLGSSNSCDTDDNINGSCYQCEKNCHDYQNLLEHVKVNKLQFHCTFPKVVTITCCLLLELCNLGRICGEDGQCYCYTGEIHALYNKTVHEPVCSCSAKSRHTNTNCDKPYTQMGVCKCFLGTRNFCGQEQIIECDNPGISTNWTQCRRTILKQDDKYNCLCTKASDTDGDSGLENC